MSKKRESYKHFSQYEIYRMLELRGKKKPVSYREIAKRIGRSESSAGSIERFLKRSLTNGLPGNWKFMSLQARARHLFEKAQKRRQIPRKRSRLSCDEKLREFVVERIGKKQESPRSIAHRIKQEGKYLPISYTTIYRFTKYERQDLRAYHRQKGKPRKQRLKPRKYARKGITKKNCIHSRPKHVGERIELGHWEGDTIHGKQNGSGYAIFTLRELATRMVFFFLLTDLTAEQSLAVVKGFFRSLPWYMRRTLTVDNGGENEKLPQLEHVFRDFIVYYCTPYSAWQRGSVENANGLFRWYYPKGTDFKDVTHKEIWEVADKINDRHMDCLNGKSPKTLYEEALKNPPLIQLVTTSIHEMDDAGLMDAVGMQFQESSGLYLPRLAA